MRPRAVFVWLLGLWLLALPALAAPPAQAIPSAPESWVTDRVGVLSAATQQSLDRRLARYERDTGHQVLVWIDHTTNGVPIETFAVEAFEKWRLGRAKLDDGLGVFVMVEDRAIRIEVGYGLEPLVTDLIASEVIRQQLVPAIQAGEWDRGIVEGVETLVDTIEGQPGSLAADPGMSEPVEQPMQTWKIIGIAALVIGFVILLIFNPRLALLLLFFSGRGGGGGGLGGGGGGFGGGGGGRSGGGGASGGW